MKLLDGNSNRNLHTNLCQNILKLKKKKKKKKKKKNLPMIVVTYFILDLVRAEMEKGMYLTLSIKGCVDVNIC